MDADGRFSANFEKGRDNGVFHTNTLLKRGLFWKERFFPKVFFNWVDSSSEGRKNTFDRIISLEIISSEVVRIFRIIICYDTVPVHYRMFEHITKTCLFKYIENFTNKKNENFQTKNSNIFHVFAQNIDRGTR